MISVLRRAHDGGHLGFEGHDDLESPNYLQKCYPCTQNM